MTRIYLDVCCLNRPFDDQPPGPVNLGRFLQQFETGYGDYTQERRRWLEPVTVEEIAQEVRQHRETEHSQRP